MGSSVGGPVTPVRVRAGDTDAFGDLYRAYSDRVYGLCVLLLADRDEAADAMHDVFITAWERIDQLRDPDRIVAWLYAIARHTCYRRTKQRDRVVDADQLADNTIDLTGDDELTPEDATALVTRAAAGLNNRDRTLLYLHLNEGLDGADLAAAAGLAAANPYSLLHRAKQQLATAIDALAVARLTSCAELATVLRDWNGTLSPLWRKRIHRHTEQCDACDATRRRARRTAALTTAAVLAAPTCAHALTAAALLEIANRRPAPTERWQPDGFPPTEPDRKRRRRYGMFVFAGALGVLLLAAMLHDDKPGRTPPTPARIAETITVLGAHTTADTTTIPPAPTTARNGATVPTTITPAAAAVQRATAPPPAPPKPPPATAPPTTKPAPVTTIPSPSTTEPG